MSKRCTALTQTTLPHRPNTNLDVVLQVALRPVHVEGGGQQQAGQQLVQAGAVHQLM